MTGLATAGPSSPRRLWWALFGLLTSCGLAWAVSAPLLAGPDEGAHAIRAAAVVRGDLLGERAPEAFPSEPNTFIRQRVPEAYGRMSEMGACFYRRPEVTPACEPTFEGDQREVEALTYEFRSQPLWYAVVGLPTLWDPATRGVYLMRFTNSVICAALLASALVSALRHRRLLPAVGVLAGVTPMVLYLAGSVNSGAVEIAASIGYWSALVLLVTRPSATDRRLVARAGVGLAVLVACRGFGPVYAVVATGACAALAPPGVLRALWARSDVKRWLGAVAVLTVLGSGWILYNVLELPHERTGSGLAFASGRTLIWLKEAVGLLGGRDVPLPWPVHALWALVSLVVLGLALATATRRHAAVVLGVLVVALSVSIGSDGFNLPPTGFFWQGRYSLPFLAGVVVVGAVVSGGRRPLPRALGDGRLLAGSLLVLLVLAQVAAFTGTLRRFAVGTTGPRNPFRYLTDPGWTPPLPGALALGLFVAGLVGTLAVLLRHSRADAAPVVREPAPAMARASYVGAE